MKAYSCWGHWTHSRFRSNWLLMSILDFFEIIDGIAEFIGLASDSQIYPKPVRIYSDTLGLEQGLWRPGRRFL